MTIIDALALLALYVPGRLSDFIGFNDWAWLIITS